MWFLVLYICKFVIFQPISPMQYRNAVVGAETENATTATYRNAAAVGYERSLVLGHYLHFLSKMYTFMASIPPFSVKAGKL